MLSGVRTLDMVKDAMQKGATAFIHKDNKAFGKIRFYAKKASIEKEVDHDEKIAWIYRIVFITVFVLAMTAMVVMHNFFPEYFNHRG